METNDQNKHGIAQFAALKTAIANGEEVLVKDLVSNGPMLDIEKSYLIDLAKLHGNRTILMLLENVTLKE
ncbi:hypothetical protein [Colwellia echini]|uniref:Uncharacterized protein n=1 Tax=Colwellia echini TaxID=1982103 RepID=A0ABY3MW85_9GAMM|nr:hypothetical protein [Colwellia echini]TYK65466.1 hypothetical protein CWS31_010250 [Colwellia echini]